MSIKEFALPDVGEGLTEAEIINWLVAPGDVIEVNQNIVEIETAKSLVELPSPYAGRVSALHCGQGETVDVGRSIISIQTNPESPQPSLPEESAELPGQAEPRLLVGYGAREIGMHRRRARAMSKGVADTQDWTANRPEATVHKTTVPKATPPVRKLAKDLGVDLGALIPSGCDFVITRDDVLQAANAHPDAREAPGYAVGQEISRDTGGDIRIPIKGVRKHTAAAMVSSAFTAPHVTEFVAVDVTRMMALRAEVLKMPEFRNSKISPLAFVCRAFLMAVQRTPQANSRWDEKAQEIIQLGNVNLGIAAATPRGLMVPNIKGAQQLGLAMLASEIAALAQTAREGKTPPSAMASGTITVTNIGVFGIDSGTPILNPGETAILAVGAIRRMPWVIEDEQGERIEPRSIMQLALSFDHRVLDGQQGSQLLADTAALLREPGLSFL